MSNEKQIIRLVDIDGKFPNIALMKISAYYKKLGCDVAWHSPMLDATKKIDKLFVSKLFKFTADYKYYPKNTKIFKGGTGFDITTKLPNFISDITDVDYNMYPDCDYSLQFFSRGCIRQCPFCVVRKKEGYIHPVNPMTLNHNGKYIEVLDNNFFASPKWREAIDFLLDAGQPVNLHGVDVRIMEEEHAYWLNKLKLKQKVHIAWDNPREDIRPKLQNVLKHISHNKLMSYVLIGYWSTPEEDFYRVEELRKLKINPYIMPFNKDSQYQKDFLNLVNAYMVFWGADWNEYKYNFFRIMKLENERRAGRKLVLGELREVNKGREEVLCD